MTIEQITMEALALSGGERTLLADRLVESLDAAEAKEIDQLWSTEVKHRLEQIRRGEVTTIPMEEALARVRRSLGR